MREYKISKTTTRINLYQQRMTIVCVINSVKGKNHCNRITISSGNNVYKKAVHKHIQIIIRSHLQYQTLLTYTSKTSTFYLTIA